ncbi:hypothetical protein [Bacillus pseudomycoides]|uniref:hypothetical protein n=1 Tax=Bacillus pseudomycoides TaxID=64104 RepID=UPI000BF0F6F7|nr:hypothetical protein [Bacillus pseudomycoides]PEJ39284.1 hypothetical protein CN677_06320 [Bacillus pseudomycoides]PGE99001.1 hypothetical protein COM62_03865 [Bacillus pseudomycoides]PHA86957.1 hypothetical protein COE78_20880 [Bacillus pseudomycoides]PHB30334.1 hypothetical protein COE80_06730 [Bacillus pseudomycoides]PHC79415.1 hypothetical protein COF38_01435 [Bacillus pseudomycoides]
MGNGVKVFQWLKEQQAPFWVQLQILQVFQMYKLIVEMDKKLMIYEEKKNRERS